jgi:hypothetical protein
MSGERNSVSSSGFETAEPDICNSLSIKHWGKSDTETRDPKQKLRQDKGKPHFLPKQALTYIGRAGRATTTLGRCGREVESRQY